VAFNPLDPRFSPWPLPPVWMTLPGGRLPKAWMNPGFLGKIGESGAWAPTANDPGWGHSGWSWGDPTRGPGVEGDLFIGKRNAPETGGWVYGLGNWYPGPRVNPYSQRQQPYVPVASVPRTRIPVRRA